MGHARKLFVLATAIFISQFAIPSTASAGGTCAGLTLSCENGRSYPLCPIAISDEGEIVTGRLGLGPRHGVHVRLVPMGVGYRYIGRSVWFDGVRNDAVLYFGKSNAVACTVVRE